MKGARDSREKEYASCCDAQSVCFYCCEALLMFVITGLALLYIFIVAPSFSARPDASQTLNKALTWGPKSLTTGPGKPTSASLVQPPPNSAPLNLIINPLKSNISPGGGYWRQQLDHIASHLKHYTLSDKQFQSDVSERKIGKIIGSNVEIREEDGVLSLCLDFELIKDSDKRLKKRARSRIQEATKKKVEQARRSRRGSFDSSLNGRKMKAGLVAKKKRKKRPQSVPPSTKPLSPETEDLIQEVQSLDRDLDEVEKLIDAGADGNGKNLDGVPVLVLAVRNFFHEAIELLVTGGADPNERFGPKLQTALHEAVLLGPPGKVTLLTLLNNGAEPEIEDKQGKTAQSLALKLGHSELADILAARIGHRLLTQDLKS